MLFLGDSPTVSTGFSRCTKAVCDELYTTGHEVLVLGINERGDPRPDIPYPIYPCIQALDSGFDVMGQCRLPVLMQRYKPDVVVLLQDPWNIPGYFEQFDAVIAECHKAQVTFTLPPIIAWLAVDSRNQKGAEINHLTHIVTWTQFAADELKSGGCTVPMSIVGLGVDHGVFHPRIRSECRKVTCSQVVETNPNAFIVGYVGRNQERKRIDLLLEYFAEWVSVYVIDDAYLYLYVAPTGEGACDIHQLIRYYGLQGRVILSEPPAGVGHSDEVVSYVYNSLDVFMTTSQAEGWCLPVLEAMACGVPCVVPDAAGLASGGGWTDGAALYARCSSSALTAPLNGHPYTVGAIPDKADVVGLLSDLYTDRRMREHYSNEGIQHAKQFTWKRTGEEFVKVIEHVMASSQSKVA